MSQKQLFDAELFKTKNLMELQIRHINSKNTPVSKKIPVYKDDSCKDEHLLAYAQTFLLPIHKLVPSCG